MSDGGLFDLSGKVALVTGASRGLGRGMGAALARAGADLAVTSRHVEALRDVARELEEHGGTVLPVELDVRDEGSIRRAVQTVLEHYGRIDVLLNNAGCNIRKPSLEVTWDDWNTVVDTNLRGAFFVAQAVAPSMLEHGRGRIVNIGSLTSAFGFAGVAAYTASRGGVRQLTMSLAAEWADRGVTVNCLAPGWFHTAQTDVLYRNAAWVDSVRKRIPLGRPGEASDLDGTVVFLASDASAYVTGQTILVDGGFSTGAMSAIVGD